ncbi:MAG: hypothetical protein D3906_17440, partial [Candidatus Electrothrix sp. AUS1_2]|nr:hypothetical protein [Candidatus Electrothrix sp. AUS1_2]
MRQQKSGRQREVDEIVKLHRAIQVAFLMMGKLEDKMDYIYPDEYIDKPRKDIKEYRKYLKSRYKQDINAFCAQNFINVKWTDLSRIYEPLYERGCLWRVPLIDFNRFFGEARNNVIKDVPLHATLVLSPLGLQVQYPEMHFIDDLTISFNSLYALEKESNSNASSWKKAKKEIKQNTSKGSFGEPSFYKRMCLLSCFNLIESYINGLSWGY